MSKFQEILKTRRAVAAEPVSALPEFQKPEFLSTQKSEDSELHVRRSKRGRPAAKRSDPDFLQVTAYIRRETHRKAKIRLLEEGQGREFSELVEGMLEQWLSSRS